ncbi:hypothetical protein GCM10023091_40410 [Ravibacter arvi]|uniref:Cadherin-like domain-containing protein n=1 Tax=Ravibacter arvi TaxID=2051041 RepID=A0ABP8MCF5_9BACT
MTYKWTAIRKSDSAPVGSFSVNNSAGAATTVFTPPTVTSPTEIVIQVVVTDACGRVAVSADNFNVTNEVSVAGKLWHDSDGNAVAGAGEKTVSGNSGDSNGGSSLVTGGNVYANLVNADNQVVQSVQVSPDGTFLFADVQAGHAYKIILTTEQKAPASTLEAADAQLPSGWVATGTNLEGAADTDNKGGVLSLGTLTGEVGNADFGMEQAPVARDKTSEALINPGGTTKVPLAASLFEASDFEDAPDGYTGNLSGREVVLFPATNGTLYYNGVAITTATPIAAFDPGKVSVDPDGTSPWSTVEVTFEFTVKDNAQVVSAPGTITVPFVPALIAINDINQTPQDVPVNGDVLTNDEGSGLSVTGATQGGTPIPVGVATTVSGVNKSGAAVSNAGSIVLNANGTYTFTPAPGFNGTINPIVYNITDVGGDTDNAILDIKVIPATTAGNDGPIAQDDNVKTEINTPISANVLVNDSDPDGDPLTVTGSSIPLGFTVQVPGKDKDGNNVPNAGTLLLKPDGSYTFTPANGFAGTVDPVDYTISDGKGGTDAAQLNIVVLPAADNTTLANDDANSAPKGKTMTGNVKSNDSDPEGNTTTVTTANANGTPIVIGNTPTVIPGAGQLTLRPDGSYTFVPDADFVGTVPVVYQVCDNGTPVACDLATLYLTTLDAVVPDLTPFVTFDPNVISGTRGFTARIRVLNLNSTSGGPTTGAKITVRVPKNAKWTVVWDGAATSNALGTLHNAIWTYSASGIYHTWTATAVIPKGGSRYIGFTGTFTPGKTMGTSPVTVQIDYPSGGETNDANNTDIESVEYSGF